MPIMDFIRQRFPPWREIYMVFLAIIFPVIFWALIFFFRELPSYLLRMHIWEIVGVLAYTQVIALLDSLLLLAIYIFLALITPRKYILDHFTAVGFTFVVLASVGAISIHYKQLLLEALKMTHTSWVTWAWFGLLAGLFVLVIAFFQKYQTCEKRIHRLIEKLMVLSSAYLVLIILGVLIVLMRNFGLR